MISGISGISAPGIITNITAASLGGISPVDRVVKRTGENSAPAPSAPPVESPQPIDPVSLGEQTPPIGEAYGLPANQLRNRGMARQLEPTDEPDASAISAADSFANESAANAPADDETAEKSGDAVQKESTAENAKNINGEPLSATEQDQVDKLESRDREVRTHEQAHLAAAGQYASGGAAYEYQTGADGKKYAVGGHVGIDVSPEATPEATALKMQQVRRAALAPAEPSGQDRAVAAEAAQMLAQAQREMRAANTQSSADENSAREPEIKNADAEISDNFAAGNFAPKTEISANDDQRIKSTDKALAVDAPTEATGNSATTRQGAALTAEKMAEFAGKIADQAAKFSETSGTKQLSYQQLRGQLAYRMAM